MMEWNVLNKLTEDWNDLDEVVVYGFGRVAQRNIGKINRDFKIKYIVDNDRKLADTDYHGIKIKRFEQVSHLIGNYKIIVVTSSFAYASIEKDLQSIGLKEFIDYCRLEDFLPEWYWKNRHEVCLSQVFSSVTSRCTFRCKHCNMLMPYYNHHYDYTAEEIMKDMELLFRRVDYLTSYFVLGGEPLLNRDLARILERVHQKFGDRIGYIQVISNGSVVPDEALLRVLKKCDIKVRISDYTHVLPYSERLQQVKDILRDNGIDYSMSIYTSWMDLGFPEKVPCIGKNVDEAKQHMLTCSPGCHILNDKKFFYCGLIFSAEKCGLYQLQDGDFIDLQKSEGSLADRKQIMKYCLGEVEKGYISICNICRGSGSDNERVIGVAEQVHGINESFSLYSKTENF